MPFVALPRDSFKPAPSIGNADQPRCREDRLTDITAFPDTRASSSRSYCRLSHSASLRANRAPTKPNRRPSRH
jgi:hypothetical protein